MEKRFLNRVYAARDADETRAFYDEWARTYEAEVGENGYATPARCAVALAAYAPDKTVPILDFGCGTGLSGLALGLTGFTTIDGIDLSSVMLDFARSKNIYRNLELVEAGGDLAHAPGDYGVVCAISSIGAGAAPISVFDTLIKSLAKGGLFVLSFSDHALKDPANEGRLNEWVDCGAARLLFREYGPHLPGAGMKSYVYVIEKN